MSDRRLTVVQLIPALQSGGAERSCLEIAAALVNAGHRALVVSSGGKLVSELEQVGGEHVKLPIHRKSLTTLRHLPALVRLLREARADIVHVRSRLPGWLAWLALKWMGKSAPLLVTTVHGLNSVGRYSEILLRGKRVICVSQTVHDYVRRYYPAVPASRLEVIPRGVSERDFPPGFTPSALWRERFFEQHPKLAGRRILCLPARGTRLKGHPHAIRLLADLRERGVDAALLLLGVREEGRESYVAELEAEVEALGLASRVVMTGSRRDVREVYAVSSVVLQLSVQAEAFGRTVIEALSIGRPVLGFAHGGVGELLAELYPTGAVPLRDRAALADAAMKLLSAPPPVAAPERYRLDRMQAATLGVYDAVLGRSA